MCAELRSQWRAGGGSTIHGDLFLSSSLFSVELCDLPHPHPVSSFSSRLQVIYALNTKNDEHEEEIESLKDAHEDEVGQHLLIKDRTYPVQCDV